MSAEAIAKVIADLKARRVQLLNPQGNRVPALLLELVQRPAVVDCTTIYQSLVAKDEPVYVYEDHPSVAPPFEEAAYCYVNEHGNVIVMHVVDDPKDSWEETAEPLDWSEVRWRLQVTFWIGGHSPSRDGPMPTTGPVHQIKIAVGHNGKPLDIRWVHLIVDYPMERWDMAQLVTLGALNFLNCSNVDVTEPKRPRGERRRIQRTGETVTEIVVRGMSSSTRSLSASDDPTSTPLTSVRGHFSHYGPEYGRGLLFGKYSGRFWIPQHARGTAEAGIVEHTYKLEP